MQLYKPNDKIIHTTEKNKEEFSVKILIVEDDTYIAQAVKEILSLKSYKSEICDSGTEAVDLIRENPYDLILLDIMLPGIDGFQIMNKIKYREIPVIFVTAKQDINDKLHGFKLGAEDYVIKPFDIMELLARVDVALRRRKKGQVKYYYGDVCLDTAAHSVSKNGKNIELTPKEFELAEYFIKNQNMTLTRESIHNAVWGGEFIDETRTIDNHVRQIRKKLGWQKCLITIYKLGYKLVRID